MAAAGRAEESIYTLSSTTLRPHISPNSGSKPHEHELYTTFAQDCTLLAYTTRVYPFLYYIYRLRLL